MAFSVQFRMAIQGKLSEFDRAVAVANTLAIRTATNRMKTQGRRQMERAGLGKKLPNAFRGTVTGGSGQDITKRGIDPNPTGIVQSGAIVKRPGGPVDLIEVFETGAVVVPKHGRFLAVPTPKAGGRRARPMNSYPEGTFRLIPRKRLRGRPRSNTPSFIAIHKVRKEVWYLLFPVIRLRKRLNLAQLYVRIAGQVDELLARSWGRELAKLEAKF